MKRAGDGGFDKKPVGSPFFGIEFVNICTAQRWQSSRVVIWGLYEGRFSGL